MRTATRFLFGALAFVLAGSAQAQDKNVTFQVDMTPYVESCQFDDATDDVVVRGNFNDWSGDDTKLADEDGDNVFTGTFAFAEATALAYKFVSTGDLGFEDETGNREYTVGSEADQEIPVVTFADGTPTNSCSSTEETYEVTFVVDMTVPIARGDLDVDGEGVDDVVAVAGSFTGWETSAFALSPESDNPNIFTGTLTQDFAVPGDFPFKYVIRTPDGSGGFTTSYENTKSDVTPLLSNGNRVLRLDGTEPVDSETGNRFVEYDNDGDANTLVSYSDADAGSLLNDAATVTFVVDLRPAFYAFADSSGLPGNVTDADLLDDVYINGPIFGESDGVMTDWASWSPEGLQDRQMTFNAADTTASITLNYSAGAFKQLAGKLSVGGADNESGFGGDKVVAITEGTQTVNLIFGAQVRADGKFNDGTDGFDFYDPYILTDNFATPPTATVVRRGGEADFAVANEQGPGRAGDLALGDVYPNPATGLARLAVSAGAEAVSVAVYDVTGRRVVSVLQDAFVSGERVVEIDTQALAAGVYVVRAESGRDVATRRLTVVR